MIQPPAVNLGSLNSAAAGVAGIIGAAEDVETAPFATVALLLQAAGKPWRQRDAAGLITAAADCKRTAREAPELHTTPAE